MIALWEPVRSVLVHTLLRLQQAVRTVCRPGRPVLVASMNLATVSAQGSIVLSLCVTFFSASLQIAQLLGFELALYYLRVAFDASTKAATLVFVNGTYLTQVPEGRHLCIHLTLRR